MRRIQELGASFLAGIVAAELVRAAMPSVGRAVSRARDDPAGHLGSESSAPLAEQRLAREKGRGREAERPGEVPVRGWKDILIRTYREFSDDQIPLIAAGCTFYTLLALFPGVTAFAALYGLFADVSRAQEHIQALSGVLPSGVISMVGDQMTKVAAAADGRLSLTFIIGLGTALWSANKAVKSVITGLNIAYEEKEKRGMVTKTLIPLAFTLGFIVLAVLAIGLGGVGAGLGESLGETIQMAWTGTYWLMLFGAVILAMALLYRYGPSRARARWRWISWGSVFAAVAWLAMSAGFTFYLSRFADYDVSYGALGAVIGFMTWTWLSSMVFLMGAELNSELEHQTARDTTTGSPRPMGARGATMADTLGEAT